MIFGEIVSNESYQDLFPSLLKFIEGLYSEVESGVQGDAYIWISAEGEIVSLDTFTSMRFQIKASRANGILLEDVIAKLGSAYKLYLYQEPEPEGHENLA